MYGVPWWPKEGDRCPGAGLRTGTYELLTMGPEI